MAAERKYLWRYPLVLTIIVSIIALWSAMCNTRDPNNIIVHTNGKAFAGSQSCQTCHKEIYATHVKTAHYLTSQPALEGNIKGSFAAGRNVFVMNDSLKAVMEKTDSGMYQVKYAGGKEDMRKRMDVVIGSGRKGQTYLYWSDNYLFQLPVSYYSPGDEWCNSPGYPTNNIIFSRNVPGQCIECHGTFLKGNKDPFGKTAYDKNSIIYGVDCERCHGPAAEHVAFHEDHPGDTKGKFIINPALLTRQQKLDNCALCHSGIRSGNWPSFSYVTGDKLDEYSRSFMVTDSTAPPDVHGNQYGLLSASKCFRMSKMTCSSCHDVHQDQAKDIAGFSQKCMNCHNGNAAPFCPKAMHAGKQATSNCIDCHMPAMASKKIFMEVSNKKDPVPALIRTHLIARYSDKKLEEIRTMIREYK
jgi:hypothetical protein